MERSRGNQKAYVFNAEHDRNRRGGKQTDRVEFMLSKTRTRPHQLACLRAFVDDQTAKIPHLLVDKSEELLSILFRSTKTEFNHSKTLRWNINGDPTGGVIAVGLALWGPEPDFFYRIGSQTFLEKLKEQEVIDAHQRQLDALLKVLEKAPSGRDVGTGIERILRFCICTKHTHVARALPPQLSEPMLQKCHERTLDFIERLLNWTNSKFLEQRASKISSLEP